MATNKKLTTRQIIKEIYSNPRFRGKHIIATESKIYATRTGEASNKIFERLVKKNPKRDILVTYVPEKGTLILFYAF